MAMASVKAKVGPGRSRAQDIDRYVGARMRERRIMLGLTQQQMAELIGVTYQQAHKYEKGINRIAGGRLYTVAQALGVEVSYFYEGLGAGAAAFEPTSKQRLLLELTRSFTHIVDRRQQEALCSLARALANLDMDPDRERDASGSPAAGDGITRGEGDDATGPAQAVGGAEPAAEVEAVAVGESEVEAHDVVGRGDGGLGRRLEGDDEVDGVVVAAQAAGEEGPEVRVVLDDEHPHR